MQMKPRFVISGISLSEPGTMGGNSKIALEIARHLRKTFEVHFIVPDAKVRTITENLADCLSDLHLHVIDRYAGNEKFNMIGAPRFYLPKIRDVFESLRVGPNDWVYACADFHSDVVPGFLLQRRYGYRWLPSAFLFVPFIVENLRKGYGFPPLVYLIGWFYARVYVFFATRRATGFVITNTSDFCHFPKRFRAGRLFPYYGGVNVEQIPEGRKKRGVENRSTAELKVVFCSRLHPQKGIDGFLDIWKEVVDSLVHLHLVPPPHLSIIGNGDPAYESYLKDKAERLGISETITWLGYVNNEAKYEIYAKSDLLVHPTVFDNNGMVAAEALCTGLPVVMYDLPALRHVYTTGCVKVPFGDKSAFAGAIVRLVTDPAHYADVAPTPDQVAALRAHWDWAARATEFAAWLETL